MRIEKGNYIIIRNLALIECVVIKLSHNYVILEIEKGSMGKEKIVMSKTEFLECVKDKIYDDD